MIDWHAPLVDAWTKQPAYVHGYHESHAHGKLILVSDVSGRKLPFYQDGKPFGHRRRIENMSPALVVRIRLVDLLNKRAAALVEEEQLLEMLAMKNVDAWGMF